MNSLRSGSALLMVLIPMSIVMWFMVKLMISHEVVYDAIAFYLVTEQRRSFLQAMMYYAIDFCKIHQLELVSTTDIKPITIHIGPWKDKKYTYEGDIKIIPERKKYRLIAQDIPEKGASAQKLSCLFSYIISEQGRQAYFIEEWSLH